MKKTIFIVLLIIADLNSFGQSKALLGQYFQNMPVFSPGLAGANDFLDLRMGFRQQWAGFEGAPQTMYFSGYGVFKGQDYASRQNSLRLSNSTSIQSEKYQQKIKHGVGGYVLNDVQGALKQFEFALNYAVHVPVLDRTYLSLGISSGIHNSKIELSDVTVKDEMNDLTYQSFVKNGASNNFFHLNGGLALYSDRYYVAYGGQQLTRFLISGNEDVYNEGPTIRHNILVGYRLFASQNVTVIPNGFIRIEKNAPVVIDMGTRVKYRENYWAGLAYRNDESLIGILGLTYNDKWSISYSYEFGFSEFQTYTQGSHEFVLGLQLYNYSRATVLW